MATTFALNLGNDLSSLTNLVARHLNAAGATLTEETDGFINLGNGQYLYTGILAEGTTAVQFYSTDDPYAEYFTIAIGNTPNIPDAGETDTVNAYLYTRNSTGVVTAGLTLYYQIIGVDDSYTDSWSDAINTVTSDLTGLATVPMYVGVWYKYWVDTGRYKTVHITADTVDPLPLEDVLG